MTGIKVYFAPWQIDLYLVKMLFHTSVSSDANVYSASSTVPMSALCATIPAIDLIAGCHGLNVSFIDVVAGMRGAVALLALLKPPTCA